MKGPALKKTKVIFQRSGQFSFPHLLGIRVSKRQAQGRNKIRWRPKQKANLYAPMFEPEVLWKQMYWSTCDIVGNFRRHLQSFGAPRSDSALP